MPIETVKNKAWFALALSLLALLFTISFNLSLYSKSNQQLDSQRHFLLKAQTALLYSELRRTDVPNSDATILNFLNRYELKAVVVLFSDQREKQASASTLEVSAESTTLPIENLLRPPGNDLVAVEGATEAITYYSQNNFFCAELPLSNGQFFVMAFPLRVQSSSFFFYIFSYQVLALLAGLLFVFFLIRWLMRPYRRVIEAAQGSPVRATTAKSESEFVVETFQALIQQLQTKESELERLHVLERRRAEKSERFSERLIANIPSGLVAVNSQGMITTVNLQVRKIFQFLDEKIDSSRLPTLDLHVEGLHFEKYFSLAPRLIDLIAQCLKTGASFKREVVEIASPTGRIRQLGLSITPILDSAQQIEGALCMMTDITEVSELRERIKLQETLANLGEMAAGLAHEFKNSLATIQGYAQLFDAQCESIHFFRQRQNTLDSMVKEVSLLSRLVTDFLNFAKPQRLSFSSVNLERLLQDCVEEVRPRFEKHQIRIAIQGTFPTLPADEILLKRVFVNLLRNAAEAIDPDAIEKQIEITGTVDQGTDKSYSHLRIRDTGCGIKADDLHNIFIPFFTTKSRGYGIGLAIVQKLIVAHGGDVSVESSDSRGTTFHCRLPLQASPLNVESVS